MKNITFTKQRIINCNAMMQQQTTMGKRTPKIAKHQLETFKKENNRIRNQTEKSEIKTAQTRRSNRKSTGLES
jgi:hypothetical protein